MFLVCYLFNSLKICKNLLQWVINQSLKILSGTSNSFLCTHVCCVREREYMYTNVSLVLEMKEIRKEAR